MRAPRHVAEPAPRSRKEPHRPKLRIVPPSTPARSGGRLGFLIVSFLLVSVMVVGVVVLQILASQSSFRLEELAKRSVELQQQRDELDYQVAELQAPGRITKEARRLGLRLIPPEDIQTITVRAKAGNGGAEP